MMSESIRDGYKMTELGELPEEWEFDILNNLTDKITDGTHHTPNYSDYGIPFLRVTDIQSNNIDFNEIKYISSDEHRELIKRCKPEKGDILYSKNGTIGITKIIDWDWDFSIFVSLCLIKTEHEKIRTDYLFYLLNSNIIKKQILLRSKQMTVTNLHLEEIKEFQIPLPPFPEQHRIAEILSTIDETIERTETLIEKYWHIKAGLMSDLLTRGIDEEGKIRSEETHEFKDSPLGRVPEGWVVEKLEKMSEFLDNKRVPIKKSDRSKMKGNIPYYGASGIIDWINNFIFNETLILLGEDGENLISRNLPLAFKITGKSWVNNHAHVIRPNKDVNIDYLTTYLENIDYKNFISGSAQPKLNQQSCLNIFIKKPELLEQHRISEILTTADTYIEKEQTYLNKLKQIKKGLMQDLLTGKVRVTTTLPPPKPAEAAT